MSSYPESAEQHELSAAPCAADGYWVTIQGGEFASASGKGFPVPSGHTLRGSWGASGTSWVAGEERQPVPNHLRLLWFAYAEDKFYQGDFALPTDKLRALLRQGYWQAAQQRPATYSELTVCVLPKGGVVVWLTGGNQVLVGRFQAAETQVTPAAFARYYGDANRATLVRETQQELPAAVRQAIAAHTVSARRWDDYLTTYSWQVAFNVPFALDQPYSLHYLSAEYSNHAPTRDPAAYNRAIQQPATRAVPQSGVFVGKTAAGARYKVRVKAFDEAETQLAFRTLHQASPAAPITLLFTFDNPFQRATLSLKNEVREIALAKTVVEVLPQ